jgi:hypothetical protein
VVEPERPDAAEYKSTQDIRDNMYASSHSTALRGALQSDVATSNQIAREADFTMADDLVEDTINSACEWMADWQMQFIKLRYTEEHMRQIVGPKGSATFVRLRRDSVSDGMEVTIKASTTDKLKAQRNALEMAKLGAPYTNPIDFFRDMDVNDPEARAERGMEFATNPAGYIVKYIQGLTDTGAMINQLMGPGQSVGAMAGVAPVAPSVAPQGPTPTNTAQVPATPPIGVPASPSNGIL